MFGTITPLGTDSPGWLGPTLVVVGTLAWTGAAASAAPRSPEPAETSQRVAVRQPDPSSSGPSKPVPVVAAEAHVPSPAPPAAVGPDEPCAPVVELTFASGIAAVDHAERLRTIAAAAAEFPARKVVVEGYASASGSATTNLQLSHRRARRARSKLIAAGLDADRIMVQAFGEYRPNVDGDEARDRRVVVKIEGVAACPDLVVEE